MPQFGFYKVGGEIVSPLTVIVVAGLEDAKRHARAVIEAEGLDAIRLWVDGQKMIEVRCPSRKTSVPTSSPADARGARMAARKAEGTTQRAIAEEYGVSKNRVRDIIATSEYRAKMLDEQPNRAALSARARNALSHLITEPEDDPTERDERLPGRVAALTRRDISLAPNLGKQTIGELEVWLWERGLTLG